MTRLRLSVGILWVLWPLALLGFELYLLAERGFDNWPRWVPFHLVLVFISACGMYFLLGWPGAKWVLRAVGLVVALYLGATALIVGGHDPDAPFRWASAAVPLSGVAFAVFSIAVAHRA